MNSRKEKKNNTGLRSAKECAFLAVFVALVITAQICFAAIPGVELVTVLFLSYSFAMGTKRGMLAATAFSLLRQIVFGFFPIVLILYLVYFNAFALLFGWLGKKFQSPQTAFPYIVLLVCLCTACFSLLDNILTPLWYGYSRQAFRAHFFASLPIMFPQVVCAACSTFFLFLPLQKVFEEARRTLKRSIKNRLG